LFLERYRKEDEKGRDKLTLAPPFSFVEPQELEVSEVSPGEIQGLLPAHVGIGK
jgi:hypothetical protein